eukprot:scaffold10932_cov55-Phaeocystis_antarctica.AAC.2
MPNPEKQSARKPVLTAVSDFHYSSTGFADVWGQFERQTELRLPPSAVQAAPTTTAEPNTSVGALGVGWTRRQGY